MTVKAVAILMDRRALRSGSLMVFRLSGKAVVVLRGRPAQGAQQHHDKRRQRQAEEPPGRAANVS